MGLFERLLKEREEEERRRGRSLGQFYGVDSAALERRWGNAPQHQRPGGPGGLKLLYHYIHKGPTNAAMGMRYMALKKKHSQAYHELKAEAQGQGELLP